MPSAASFVLMVVATLVDATDGTMARKIGVKRVLPNFDGRKLDDLTDFLTYTFLPLLLIWRAELLPEGSEHWLLLPLLASAYGFCQVEAKTDDGYFLGFPSLWNVVAFYLYVLHAAGRGGPRRGRGAEPADLRAEPLPLPLAAGPAQHPEQRAGRPLGAAPRLGPLEDADGAVTLLARPDDRAGARLALLSGLLHGRLVGDHPEALAPARLIGVAADPPG